MFTNNQPELWEDALQYVNDATYYYSKWLGDYPYNNVTAVDGTISAGGGMEYPNVTVIGSASSAIELELVIAHEVGHNWLYGILGSNERDHAWMDEGMNSYYEYRYMTQYYGARADFGLPKFISKSLDGDLYELGLLFQGRRRLDQAPDTPSDDFSQTNYGLSSYMKPGTAFGHLEQYLGFAIDSLPTSSGYG